MKNLSRFGLERETTAMLLDWCVANYNANATDVISEAVKTHIQARLDNEPEMKKRYKAAQQRRLGGSKPKIVAMKDGE